jgi:hypothetical protein
MGKGSTPSRALRQVAKAAVAATAVANKNKASEACRSVAAKGPFPSKIRTRRRSASLPDRKSRLGRWLLPLPWLALPEKIMISKAEIIRLCNAAGGLRHNEPRLASNASDP